MMGNLGKEGLGVYFTWPAKVVFILCKVCLLARALDPRDTSDAWVLFTYGSVHA